MKTENKQKWKAKRCPSKRYKDTKFGKVQQTLIQNFFWLKLSVMLKHTYAIEAKSIIEDQKGKLKEIEKLEDNINFNSYIIL